MLLGFLENRKCVQNAQCPLSFVLPFAPRCSSHPVCLYFTLLEVPKGKGTTRHKWDGKRQKCYLQRDVVADLTLFHLVLIHGVDVLLHLYDASGGQCVFTLVLNK